MFSKEEILAIIHDSGLETALSVREKAIANDVSPTWIIQEQDSVPDWKEADYTTRKGMPVYYQPNDQVYTIYQPHNSTGQPTWNPTESPALFKVLHSQNPAMAKPYIKPSGTHDTYMIDDCAIYNDKIYSCRKDNIAYNPDEQPDAWELIVGYDIIKDNQGNYVITPKEDTTK